MFECGLAINKQNWLEVFSASLGKITANQLACNALVVKEQKWDVNLSEGTLSFGEVKYPLQFLGSESTTLHAWLWGYKNINHFPSQIITLATQIQQTGQRLQLLPLTTEEFELNEWYNGHTLSIVSCALSSENICYYRVPHESGAIYVAFGNVPKEVFQSVSAEQFLLVTARCIEQHPVNHKIFVQSFFFQNHTLFFWENNHLVGQMDKRVIIEFEETQNGPRIKNMRTEL